MDERVELLEQFYHTMRHDQLKLETKKYGFEFIDELTAEGMTLDYGQLDNSFIHKYRLQNVSGQQRQKFLLGHINQEYNTCLYFDKRANNVLCFNLDNNFKTNCNEIIPEMKLAVKYLREHLGAYGMETISIRSGRGYHNWCRFDQSIDNQRLFNFMLRIAAKTLASIHVSNHDYHTIKFNFCPNPKVVDVVSIRLFGSKHVKTGKFTHVQLADDILSEEESWKYFESYMLHKTIPEQQFTLAYDEMARAIPL